jgi:hypothetical protein
LIADPAVSAKTLMERLAALIPDAYASKAQLRTLQRRVKAWRAERAKEMILGRLRAPDAMSVEVSSGGSEKIGAEGGRALRARQATDIWTMRLRRTGADRGQRAATRLRCPPPPPSTTCPQPSTIKDSKRHTE